MDLVIVGIRGTVLGLDRTTGDERWRTKLSGLDVVLTVVEGPRVYATTRGQIWCLDISTGGVIWNNNLRGLGLGVATVAVPAGPATQADAVLDADVRRRRNAAAS